MKTAILLTGHMRTFARCLPTLRWHVLRHCPGLDIFVSTVQDADTPSAELLHTTFPTSRVEIDVVEAQPHPPIPVPPTDPNWQPGRNQIYTHEPYALSVPPIAVLRQLWQLNHAWEHLTRHADPYDYDLIIRARPDSYLHSFNPADLEGITPSVAKTPWWGRFGGINDRFALLGPAAAEAYHTTHRQILMLLAEGCPLHPESLIKANLELSGMHVEDRLRVEFTTLKHDGARPPEITPIDLAHAGLG